MSPFLFTRRSMWLCTSFGGVLSIMLAGMTNEAHALCGLDGAVREQLRSVDDLQSVRTLSRKIHLFGTCSACHIARCGGPRNEFGNAVNSLLTLRDREDPVRQREAGRRMRDILANPALPDSPTFGDLFRQGRFPAGSLANPEAPLPKVPGKTSENVTVQQARQLVQEVEAESRFGILQLSRTYEITSEVAEVLAEFQGDTLILGIKSLSPEVAAALANSRAANVWLHSVTSVSPKVAESIAEMRSHLLLTGLVELDSVPLAEKLASRPGALSFPYLKQITAEIASTLARNERSLTLAGLTRVSPEIQEQLADTVGALSLPNLTSLDSLSLAKKMAATAVLLPKVERLTVEQVAQLVGAKGQVSFWGGVYFPLGAITPEIARAIAANPRPVNLTLVGNEPLSDESLRILLKSGLKITLGDVEELTPDQIRVVGEVLDGTTFRPGVLEFASVSLPKLQKLNSAILAETLARSAGFNFFGVTSISPEAAAALGSLPDAEYSRRDGTVEVRPSGNLSFPSLEELSPETARLLLKKRWLSISLPALQDVSVETVRLMARQTFRLNLGIPALPPEFADAFAQTPTDMNMGGGYIQLPNVSDISPEAAKILVQSLNRGVQDLGHVRLSKSPKLYFGGDFGFSASGFPRLSPEVAVELAGYEGVLAIQGLGELPDESAAALASFPGPYLILSGPAAEKLSPAAAESLAKVPGVLQIGLRELDSVPLAQRFARQINWTLSNLETVSREAAPSLCEYKQFFNLRALTVLDSPEMARRFVEGTTVANSITLPSLSELSAEAAEIVAGGSKSLFLGLRVLDSCEVALALAKSQSGVKLPRLRAATSDVIAILKDAPSIDTPPLESVYVLSESQVD